MSILFQNHQQLEQLLSSKQQQLQYKSPQQVQDQLNIILDELSAYIVFNQGTLNQVQQCLNFILQQYATINITPGLSIWRMYFTDMSTQEFNINFCQALFIYYCQLTECSQLFRSQPFNDLSKSILLLMTIFAQDRVISDDIRHSKCLRALQRMLRIECTEELLLAMCIVTKNHKNCEYLTIKKTQDNLMQLFKNGAHRDLVSIVIANMCYSTDQRLLFWCAGITQQVKPSLQLSNLALQWRLCYDANEVIEDFMKYQDFYVQIYKLCVDFSEEVAFMVGIIRKLCESNQHFREQHSIGILKQFRRLFDMQPAANIPKPIVSFIYKELFSFIGILGSSLDLSDFVAKIVHTIFQNVNDCRVVTTGIGCLTNMATQQVILDQLHLEKDFFQLILAIFEQHHEKLQLVEYTLKLITNTLPNRAAAMQYSQPRINPTNLTICYLIIRIFRGLYIINKPYVDILMQCITEVQNKNPDFNFMILVAHTMEYSVSNNRMEIVGEAIMLLSIVPQLNLTMVRFQAAIKQYVEAMKLQGELKKALQIVSCLPIEDMGLQF